MFNIIFMFLFSLVFLLNSLYCTVLCVYLCVSGDSYCKGHLFPNTNLTHCFM